MRFLKVCSTVVGLGLLLILASCTDTSTSRNDTEDFIGGAQMMFANAAMSESSMMLQDFSDSDPPAPELSSVGSLEASTQNLRALRDPFGIDTLYGTWRFYPGPEWRLFDPDDPANAILFQWDYLDTANIEHDAELLIDSLEFYEGAADTLPTNIWIGLNLDGDDIAWIKLGAHYISADEADSAYLIYEIIDYYQIGVSVATAFDVADIDSSLIDSADFIGTVRLWAINRDTDYRIDYSITRYVDDSGRLVLEDSRDWRMVVDVSVVVEEDEGDQRRDVEGEITHNGEHAAYIEGYVWEPDDGNHGDMITIIFSDDTEGDYTYVSGLFEGLLE